MKLRSDEVRLDGRWELVGSQMVADAVCERIGTLIEKHLQRVATTGWDVLYRDPQDGRYWELLYPHSEMHGGGPPSLVRIAQDSVGEKYGMDVFVE